MDQVIEFCTLELKALGSNGADQKRAGAVGVQHRDGSQTGFIQTVSHLLKVTPEK